MRDEDPRPGDSGDAAQSTERGSGPHGPRRPALARDQEGSGHNRRSTPRLVLFVLEAARSGTTDERLYVTRCAVRAAGLACVSDEAQAEAVDALRACMEDGGLSRAPARHVYRDWVAGRPSFEDWPSDFVVAESFGGSWTRAKDAADGPGARGGGESAGQLARMARPGAKDMSKLGEYPTPTTLRQGLRWWLESEHCDPERHFAAYCRYGMARVRADASMAPYFAKDAQTLRRHLGPWMAALADPEVRGLDDVSLTTYLRLSGTMRARKRRGARADLDAIRSEFRSVLRAAADYARELGKPLTSEGVEAYRLAVLTGGYERREAMEVPSVATIKDFYGGSLTDALLDAGIINDAEAARRRIERGENMDERVVAWWLREAVRSCEVHSDRGYRAWRAREAIARGCAIPSIGTVYAKLGVSNFDRAVEKALPMDLDWAHEEFFERYRTEQALRQAQRRAAGRDDTAEEIP